MAVGPVTGCSGQSLHVNEGSGEARVFIRDSVAFKRPAVEAGELWSVVGIVSQHVVSPPYEGGYRLLPRYETDLTTAPLTLPVMGGEAGATATGGVTDRG